MDMVTQCCDCKKVRVASGFWSLTEIAPETVVSHGYCPDCAAKAHRAFEEYCQQQKAAVSGAKEVP